jgi:mannitol/fructose-specific phosphotransferase system IIA component (Ntr-type)
LSDLKALRTPVSIEVTANSVVPATLADFTRPGLVIPQLRERDTAGIISELSQALQREGAVPDVLPFYHTALNQELLTSSALDCGLAVPHARLSGAKQLLFALGRAPHPVLWGANGATPVELIFLLAVPATDAAGYLHLLACLARLGRQSGWLAELRRAFDTESMMAVLEKIRLRPTPG